MTDAEPIRQWLQIVRGEFLEIPGLQLTRPQVQRFWGFDDRVCAVVLDSLVAERFLRLTTSGQYTRTDPGRYRPVATSVSARHVPRPSNDTAANAVFFWPVDGAGRRA